MELYDMLHPMLELSISIPAIILCFLPMKNHLNGKGKLLLLWGIPTLILWCVGAGWLCWRLRYSTKLCMLLTQALLLRSIAKQFRYLAGKPSTYFWQFAVYFPACIIWQF